MISVNLMGTMHCCRAVAPGMMKQQGGASTNHHLLPTLSRLTLTVDISPAGVIVNIGSVVGSCGNAGQTAYSAAKSGITGTEIADMLSMLLSL